MKCAINQPTYLPWMGQFNLMDQVDVFVFYDDVQLVKQSWDIRNLIKTSQGPLWLSIPILHDKSFFEMKFNNTCTDQKKKWKLKHFKSIQNAYTKAPFYKTVIEWLEPVMLNDIELLGNSNIHLITSISRKIGITTRFVNSTDLNSQSGVKDERLVAVCKELGADSYLSPFGAHSYIESNNSSGAFANSGVELFYHNYTHPVYPQIHGDFLEYMCVLDLLFNVGFDNALPVIRSGRKDPLTSDDIKNKNEK
ncbi:MAG: WbqC family protein [Bacteroidota bacterium]